MRMFLAAALVGTLFAPVRADDKDKEKKVEELLKKIEMAAKEKKYDDMIKFAKEAEPLDEKNPAIPFALGSAYTAQRKNQEAADAFTKVIELTKDAPVAIAYDRRGDANLKLGKFADAVKDFDKYHELRKADDKVKAEHWRRGIALYYAGKYEDGVKQFDLHKGPNPEDVENAVWHYLCSVKAGKKKEDARKDLIAVKDDNRVPMKKIHDMFAGKCQPAEVIAEVAKLKLAGEALKEAEFYGHLYVALYYDSEGKVEDCLKHLKEAVEKHKIGHYMWDVGAAHLKVLEKK